MNASPLGPRFVRIWTGQILSLIGSTVSAFGVAVAVYLDTGSEAWLGLLSAMAALPVVLVGPLLGHVDRHSRRAVMLAGDTFAAVGPVVALVLAATGTLSPWHLVVATFIGGLGSAVQSPAAMAAIPSLVEPSALDRANGLAQLGPAAGLLLGPAIATPLVARWGIEAVLVLDVITFAIAVTLTATTPFADITADPADDGVEDDHSWATAWRWLRGDGRPLLSLLALLATLNFGLAFINLAILAVATNVAGPARAGLVVTTGGLALVAGTLLVAKRGLPQRKIRAISMSLAVFGLATMAAGSRPVTAVVVIGAAVALASVPVANAAVSSLFHQRVPATMQGRVFGLRMAIGQALNPLGSILAGILTASILAPAMAQGGALADTLGPIIGRGEQRGPAVLLIGVGFVVAALSATLNRSPNLRSLDGPTANPVSGPIEATDWQPPDPRHEASTAGPPPR